MSAPNPIMIIAPMGRSGTSFFKAMLATHPDLYLTDVAEDYLGYGAQQLEEYVDGLFTLWERAEGKKYSGSGPFDRESLLAELGSTLLTYIGATDPTRRPVLKSPSFGDLEVSLKMFPTANFLILIRDPRSIAESYLRVQDQWGFDFTFDELAANWAMRARSLMEILKNHQDAVNENRLVIVRYEKLFEAREETLNGALERIGVAPFPSGSTPGNDFPIIGSSFDSRTEDGRVSFNPIEVPKGFDPQNRWAHWSPERHGRFNRLCGEMMKRWGYTPVV